MKKGIKITLYVLLVNLVIIGCSQDPKIEYIEVPVSDCPTHHNDGNCELCNVGEQNHDNCSTNCDHGDAVIPCNDATACINGAYAKSVSLNNTVYERCNANGCIDYTAHNQGVKDRFGESAMAEWEANGGPVHITNNSVTPSPFMFQDPYTKRNVNPCIGNEALTTAYNAAMARLDEIHPME